MADHEVTDLDFDPAIAEVRDQGLPLADAGGSLAGHLQFALVSRHWFKVLAYRPKPVSKPAKKRKRRIEKIAKEAKDV